MTNNINNDSVIMESLFNNVNKTRLEISATTDREEKLVLGQFFTEPRIASFMSKMFGNEEEHVKLLDPGAGIGILATASVIHFCNLKNRPKSIELIAVEIDSKLISYLEQSLENCKSLCEDNEILFNYEIITNDFVDYAANLIKSKSNYQFTKVILNPPYKKIYSKSLTRRLLNEVGIETTNYYTAFVALSKRLLQKNGELIAITPRSFCNGTYFKSFRIDFLSDMRFRKIHIFDSRDASFKDDEVLQENIIYHAVKTTDRQPVEISSSFNIEGKTTSHMLDYDRLIEPLDTEKFIRILRDESDLKIKLSMEGAKCTLDELGIKVSTGKVVDFRTKANLRDQPEKGTVPLIYPFHFNSGYVNWPVNPAPKPNAILQNEFTQKMLVPKGNYVLVKRFSSKEEPKRIVPSIYKENFLDAEYIGFENHVNYFHINGQGLSLVFAKGLAVYLSSTVVDGFFRQFNGHTQVNVGDLKNIPYPTYDQVIQLGSMIGESFPSQEEVDQLIEDILHIFL